MEPSGEANRAGSPVRRQEVTADLGRQALETDDHEALMRDASRAVGETLDVDYCEVLESLPGGEALLFREGVGWRDRADATVPAGPGTMAGAVLRSGDPVVVTDLAADGRFSASGTYASHGVVSGVGVLVGTVEEPWGVLGAYAAERRAFDDTDVAFVRNVANVLASAIETSEAARRLEAERTLKEHIVETTPVGITVVGPDGDLRFANERAEAILGRPRDEIESFSHDDDRWGLTDADGDPLPEAETPFERVAAKGEPVFDMEVGLRRPDGERIWVLVNGAPLTDEAPGGSAGAVFTLTDVTEQRRLEREFEEILGRITDAFYALDEDFRFTHVNDRAAELLQRPEDELLGETLWDIYPEAAEIDEVWDAFHTALNEQEATSYELFYPPLDFWVEANLYPSETGVSVYFRDVTDQKHREEELQRTNERLRRSNERLEQFAYAASHDLQEPLRMVSSYLQLIQRRYADDLDADGREFLEYAVDGADRMREMIDGLLAYSRVETGGGDLEPVDLEAVLEDVLEDLRVRIEETGATVDRGPLPTVRGDASQLRQVFQNLLENALTYSEGPPEVDVSATRRDGEWVVAVEDQGVGIPEEETDAIFEVFERLHSREVHSGTGIGLALCQRILERHGGDIWVDSEPGEGSTFHVALPAAGETDG